MATTLPKFTFSIVPEETYKSILAHRESVKAEATKKDFVWVSRHKRLKARYMSPDERMAMNLRHIESLLRVANRDGYRPETKKMVREAIRQVTTVFQLQPSVRQSPTSRQPLLV